MALTKDDMSLFKLDEHEKADYDLVVKSELSESYGAKTYEYLYSMIYTHTKFSVPNITKLNDLGVIQWHIKYKLKSKPTAPLIKRVGKSCSNYIFEYIITNYKSAPALKSYTKLKTLIRDLCFENSNNLKYLLNNINGAGDIFANMEPKAQCLCLDHIRFSNLENMINLYKEYGVTFYRYSEDITYFGFNIEKFNWLINNGPAMNLYKHTSDVDLNIDEFDTLFNSGYGFEINIFGSHLKPKNSIAKYILSDKFISHPRVSITNNTFTVQRDDTPTHSPYIYDYEYSIDYRGRITKNVDPLDIIRSKHKYDILYFKFKVT